MGGQMWICAPRACLLRFRAHCRGSAGDGCYFGHPETAEDGYAGPATAPVSAGTLQEKCTATAGSGTSAVLLLQGQSLWKFLGLSDLPIAFQLSVQSFNHEAIALPPHMTQKNLP